MFVKYCFCSFVASLTLYAIVVLVVVTEVVGQLSAHHRLLDEAVDRLPVLRAALPHLQHGTLHRDLPCEQRGELGHTHCHTSGL